MESSGSGSAFFGRAGSGLRGQGACLRGKDDPPGRAVKCGNKRRAGMDGLAYPKWTPDGGATAGNGWKMATASAVRWLFDCSGAAMRIAGMGWVAGTAGVAGIAWVAWLAGIAGVRAKPDYLPSAALPAGRREPGLRRRERGRAVSCSPGWRSLCFCALCWRPAPCFCAFRPWPS